MASDTPHPMDDGEAPPTAAELNDPDFQVGLKALLEAYQGTLEQDLERARDPAALTREVLGSVARAATTTSRPRA